MLDGVFADCCAATSVGHGSRLSGVCVSHCDLLIKGGEVIDLGTAHSVVLIVAFFADFLGRP